MGINTHVYTVYGVRLDWNDDFYDAYEEIEEALLDEFGWGNPQEADKQVEAIVDGMGGEYILLGSIIYDSGDFRYCEDMNNYQEIGTSDLLNLELEYKELFARLYPDHVHLLEGKEFRLINLIHYS
jgi:hypothetical protein